jgi:glycosyltransferase involved in cell wall biosynthesis
MRILITSFDFAPSIGGIETAGETLARGLAARGHEVTVVTATPGNGADDFPFKVVRQPSRGELLKLVRANDVVWQNHISLRFLWPLLIVRKPLIIMHHLVLETDVGSGPRHGALKRLACRLGVNAFASEALQKAARLPGPVIYNAYDSKTFHPMPQVPRERDVVFLGRLQPYKGPDILIDALAQLAASGQRLSATVIGGGPEDAALKAQAQRLGVADQMEFTGPLRGETLARKLNAHRVMAIPSRGEEAFAITALEGLACGCVIVGALSGGVPEAIGPCGPIVPQNDPAALAKALDGLLNDESVYAAYHSAIPRHLAKFSTTALIDSAEALIATAVRG